MPYLKENDLPHRGEYKEYMRGAATTIDPNSYSSVPAALTWMKTNWMYIVGAIGALIVIALLVYFYKKGVLFGSNLDAGSIY